jgi:hypothetical protein
MGQCVVIASGAVVESLADPCTGFVLLTPAEYSAMAANPFVLSAEDGAAVAMAVVGVWVVAFAFRALFRVIRGSEEEPGHS